MPKIKTKQPPKIQTPCTKCFEPVYVKFNYSYTTKDAARLSKDYKAKLFDRMLELSQDTYLVLSGKDKYQTFEFVPQKEIGIRKQIPPSFEERFPEESKKKFAIMRLYPNNNPIVGRIIGIMIKNIFYVFFIDIGGKLYHH